MRLCVLDIESFYDQRFSISKITTEEYVRSPLFETIGLAYKFDNGPTTWVPGIKVAEWLASEDWSDTAICCQNTAFDGAILSWLYGVKPKLWIDTLSMSRALYPHEKSHSLDAQSTRMGVGVKGKEVLNALGKRRADFSMQEMMDYAKYCQNDVDLTYALFDLYMKAGFPQKELRLIDLTLRMFIEPALTLDKAGLLKHYDAVVARKAKLIDALRDTLLDGADPEYVKLVFTEGSEGIKKLLMSNDKFADLLRMAGVEPPTKISATTGKTAFAFAKTDEAFKALEEHESLDVQALYAARLGNKTTLEETRTQRFIDIADRGTFPVPLRYYGAATGRWSGQDKINIQNLPSRGANAKNIKKCIVAPPGYVVIDCDSAQIEARCLAWEAGQTDLIETFAAGGDVYSLMASKIYGRPIDRKMKVLGEDGKEYAPHKREGEVGKASVLGCFGADTLVLTVGGWKRIVDVSGTDMLWDGESWVTHQGVIPQGEKQVVHGYGVYATPDHAILTEHGWQEWKSVLTNPSHFQSAIRRGSSQLPTGNANSTLQGCPTGGTLAYAVPAGGRVWSIGAISLLSVLRGAMLALKKRVSSIGSTTGGTPMLSQTTPIGSDCLTGYPRVSPAAITPRIHGLNFTVAGAFRSILRGVSRARSFSDTSLPCPDGMSPSWSLTESTTILGTPPATFGLLPGQRIWQTGGVSRGCSKSSTNSAKKMQTYDIAYAGPRNRYTILSSNGPLVVHNCGYGLGAVKFESYLKTTAGITMTPDQCKQVIGVYRESVPKIVELWARAGDGLRALMSGQTMDIDVNGIFKVVPDKGILLPSGLYIQYPELRSVRNAEGRQELVYTSKGLPTRIYGGKVIENLTQGLARCVVAEQMLRIAKRYKVVMTVHDSVVAIAPEDQKDEAIAYIVECMSWVPPWATGLPLSCEAGAGKTYGEC